jgi:hypothetical protein
MYDNSKKEHLVAEWVKALIDVRLSVSLLCMSLLVIALLQLDVFIFTLVPWCVFRRCLS